MPSPEAEQFEDLLEQPFIEDFSDTGHKIRRNLLLFSSIALFILLNDLSIEEKASFLGFTITNLDPAKVLWGIFFIITYHFVHFIWIAHEHYQKYTLRLSGVWSKQAQIYRDTGHPMTWTTEEAERSTLYSWIHIVRNNHLTKQFTGLNEKFDRIEENLKQITNNPENIRHITVPFATLQEAQRSLDALTLNVKVIERKLRRFENKAFWYARRNSLKWLLLEFGLPSLMGAFVWGLCLGKISLLP